MTEEAEDYIKQLRQAWKTKLEQLKEHRDELASNTDPDDVVIELVIDCIDDVIELFFNMKTIENNVRVRNVFVHAGNVRCPHIHGHHFNTLFLLIRQLIEKFV